MKRLVTGDRFMAAAAAASAGCLARRWRHRRPQAHPTLRNVQRDPWALSLRAAFLRVSQRLKGPWIFPLCGRPRPFCLVFCRNPGRWRGPESGAGSLKTGSETGFLRTGLAGLKPTIYGSGNRKPRRSSVVSGDLRDSAKPLDEIMDEERSGPGAQKLSLKPVQWRQA